MLTRHQQAVQHAANTTSLSIDVLSSQGRWGRLIRLDEQANADCSSPYHVAWPECRTLRDVKLADVCDMMGSWTSRKLQVVLDICTLVPQLPNLPRPQGACRDRVCWVGSWKQGGNDALGRESRRM